METLITLGIVAVCGVGIVKLLGNLFDATFAGGSPVRQETRSMFDDDSSDSSESMFKDGSASGMTSDDDSPSRGLWDVTSTYYSMMHSDDHSIGSGSFDDSSSMFDSSTSFDDSSSSFSTSSSFDD
jgi:hypothetical protein